MVFWKEWRETRFGFLAGLLFLSGLYYSLPGHVGLIDGYFLGIFLAFFGMACAIVYGSSAVAPEVSSDTITFLISKPAGKSRLLASKYVVRVVELILIVVVPMFGLVEWEERLMSMWVRPYLAQQYILAAILAAVFVFSASFFFSVLFRKRTLSVLAGVGVLGAYTSLRGVPLLQSIYRAERIENEICLLIFMSLTAFAGSLCAFKLKDF